MYRITTTTVLGFGLAGLAFAQPSSAYQQAQRFIEQLSVHDGVIAWSGVEVSRERAEAERQWGKPFRPVPDKGDAGRSSAIAAKDDVEVRLSFVSEGGPSYLDTICASQAAPLSVGEIEALQRLALKRLRGLERPDPNAPSDEPLRTESSELVVDQQTVCVRVGAAYD